MNVQVYRFLYTVVPAHQYLFQTKIFVCTYVQYKFEMHCLHHAPRLVPHSVQHTNKKAIDQVIEQ